MVIADFQLWNAGLLPQAGFQLRQHALGVIADGAQLVHLGVVALGNNAAILEGGGGIRVYCGVNARLDILQRVDAGSKLGELRAAAALRLLAQGGTLELGLHIRNGHILVVRAKTDGVLILFLSFHRGDCPDDKKDKQPEHADNDYLSLLHVLLFYSIPFFVSIRGIQQLVFLCIVPEEEACHILRIGRGGAYGVAPAVYPYTFDPAGIMDVDTN